MNKDASNTIISEIRKDLTNQANPNTRKQNQHYFKEEIQHYGLKMVAINAISKMYFKIIKEESKKDIFILCEKLWQSGYLEEGIIACRFSYKLRKEYEPCDFSIFEKWISKYINNWATCDTFCNKTMGDFLIQYPDYIKELKRFAKSENQWLRRAAAVSLIIPARKGLFLEDIFEIADILLLDKEDLVQKGYGWMLKVTSQTYEKEVIEYIVEHKALMPRTALRYAVEKMPKKLKDLAMDKQKPI